MTQKQVAITRAKNAHWLWITRAVRELNFHSYSDFYMWQDSNGYVVILKLNGTLRATGFDGTKAAV